MCTINQHVLFVLIFCLLFSLIFLILLFMGATLFPTFHCNFTLDQRKGSEQSWWYVNNSFEDASTRLFLNRRKIAVALDECLNT